MAVKRRSCRENAGPSSSPMHGSHSSATKPSHFFKIILSSTIDDQKLKIPVKFAKKFGKELSGVATVTVRNGHTWQLGLERAEKRILFVDGWQEFMDYHSISYGYLLVFKYKGFSKFNVCIFDKSATEIDYPCNGQSSIVKPNFDKQCLEDEEEEASAADDDVEILESKPHLSSTNRVISEQVGRKRKTLCKSATILKCKVPTRSKKCKLEGQIKKEVDDNLNENETHCPQGHDLSAKHEDGGVLFVSIRLYSYKMSEESKRAIHAARSCKRSHPSFMVLLRKSNFTAYQMDVPREFVKRYMHSCSEFMKLEVFNGKQWRVRFSFESGSTSMGIRIKKGLVSFLKDNNLKVGDVCVFELIKNSKHKGKLLKVSMYHAADYADISASSDTETRTKQRKQTMAAEPRRFQGNPKRRSDSPARKPVHFFKNILPSTLHDRRLKIPKKFSEKFGDELSAVASISVPNGRTWHLGLQKAGNRILFADNWQRFVEYHSIDSGYFLSFRYQGFSNFHVIIFDRSHIEIKYPCHVQSTCDSDDDVQPNFDKQSAEDLEEGDTDDDDDVLSNFDEQSSEDDKEEDTDDDNYEILKPKPHIFSKTKRRFFNGPADQHAGRKRKKLCKSTASSKCKVPTRSKNCKSKRPMDQIELDGDDESIGGKVNENEMHCPHDLSAEDEDVLVSRQFSSSKMSKESKRAIRAAKSCKRTHPSFLVLLRKSNMYNYYVDVPVDFVKKYMLSCSEFIQLEGFNGNQWDVRCKTRTDSSMIKRFAGGMCSFMVDNNLKEGDVCLFELIKKKGVLLKVSICHAVEHA